jgi:hypothetical protein
MIEKFCNDMHFLLDLLTSSTTVSETLKTRIIEGCRTDFSERVLLDFTRHEQLLLTIEETLVQRTYCNILQAAMKTASKDITSQFIEHLLKKMEEAHDFFSKVTVYTPNFFLPFQYFLKLSNDIETYKIGLAFKSTMEAILQNPKWISINLSTLFGVLALLAEKDPKTSKLITSIFTREIAIQCLDSVQNFHGFPRILSMLIRNGTFQKDFLLDIFQNSSDNSILARSLMVAISLSPPVDLLIQIVLEKQTLQIKGFLNEITRLTFDATEEVATCFFANCKLWIHNFLIHNESEIRCACYNLFTEFLRSGNRSLYRKDLLRTLFHGLIEEIEAVKKKANEVGHCQNSWTLLPWKVRLLSSVGS